MHKRNRKDVIGEMAFQPRHYHTNGDLQIPPFCASLRPTCTPLLYLKKMKAEINQLCDLVRETSFSIHRYAASP